MHNLVAADTGRRAGACTRVATAPAALKLRDTVLAKGDLLVATGRNGLSRGVLLVKANGGKPVVVGVGY